MSVILVTSDLVFASRAEAVARELAVTLRVVGDIQAVQQRCRDDQDPVRLIAVDLETVGLDVGRVVEAAGTTAAGRAVVLAYGPHVQQARLTAAKQAGCDQVLTRGQFSSRMRELLQAYAA